MSLTAQCPSAGKWWNEHAFLSCLTLLSLLVSWAAMVCETLPAQSREELKCSGELFLNESRCQPLLTAHNTWFSSPLPPSFVSSVCLLQVQVWERVSWLVVGGEAWRVEGLEWAIWMESYSSPCLSFKVLDGGRVFAGNSSQMGKHITLLEVWQATDCPKGRQPFFGKIWFWKFELGEEAQVWLSTPCSLKL